MTKKSQIQMIDVSDKDITTREAVAQATMVVLPETLEKIQKNEVPKGDVFAVARVAGIMAAKETPRILPLCHPVPLTKITLDFEASLTTKSEAQIGIRASVRADWKTGVEMEALTAVTAAALTVYDMCKSFDRGMKIHCVELLKKSGGRSGHWEK